MKDLGENTRVLVGCLCAAAGAIAGYSIGGLGGAILFTPILFVVGYVFISALVEHIASPSEWLPQVGYVVGGVVFWGLVIYFWN
jgi:hypothetical protein